MRFSIFFLLSLFVSTRVQTQTTDTSKWLRAFPVTDYMLKGNDTTHIVQIQLPDGFALPPKTLGMLYGTYHGVKEDAVEKGYGRCQLIKGDYYYFAISHNKSGKEIKAGDLLYTLFPKTSIHYGDIPKLAGHFIRLMDVYDTAFYDRYKVFAYWTKEAEAAVIGRMIKDIQFTGSYFKENNPGMDVKVKSGEYKDQSTFELMIDCTPQMLSDFFGYINVKPRLYAGREWKLAEIFATWLSEGAPKVVKE